MMPVAQRVRAIPGWQVTLAVALLALGFLIAAQLQSEGPRVQYTTQERQPLVTTAEDLQAKQDQLKAQILDLRSRIETLESRAQGSAVLVRQLNDELADARMAAGLVPIEGPGLVLQLEDSSLPVPQGGNSTDYLVSARDVRTIVEQLWLAGAEAIAVNAERITGTSAILDIGGSVLVNSAYLSPPYQVSAIGPSGLYDRLSHSSGFIAFVRARAEAFQIGIRFAELPSIDLPAFAGAVTLRYGQPLPSPSPTASPSPSSSGPSRSGGSATPTTKTPSANPGSTEDDSPRASPAGP